VFVFHEQDLRTTISNAFQNFDEAVGNLQANLVSSSELKNITEQFYL
jgi:hypothetical protein